MSENFLFVAAVDFGTTFSGYAFSFKSKPNEIMMNKNWGTELGCDSYKTPTSVMTNPDGSFHSFGYAAELAYSELDPNKDKIGGSKGYNLYRQFKMILHNEKISLRSRVASIQGHQREAIDIFAMALKFLFQHMMDAITQQLASKPNPADVRLVLTVPAIWWDEAKAFMREAVSKAGITSEGTSKNLLLSLEPEAASVFCRTLELKGLGVKGNLTSGERILVLDAGGGTVDITVHELQFSGDVKEVSSPSGGPWGGKTVDENFVSLLKVHFGSECIGNYREKDPQGWLKLMTTFDTAKKTFKPNGNTALRVDLGYSFCCEISMQKGKRIEDVLKDLKGVSFSNGYLVIDHGMAADLFAGSVGEIISHVKRLMGKVKNLNYILLVGGYGQCEVLKEACRKHFGASVNLLIPHEAQLAIVKGAVLFGHNPLQITSRIARFTYGTDVRKAFIQGVHKPTKKVRNEDGYDWCDDCFDVFITKNEEVKTGDERYFNYCPTVKSQTAMGVCMYKADKEKVMYVDEPDVSKVGYVTLYSSDGPLGNKLEVKVTVGHTEILVEARDKSKGSVFPVKTTVDFMSY